MGRDSLWIAYNTFFEDTTLARVDMSGFVLQTYNAPLQKIYSTVWADGSLWVVGKKESMDTEEKIFRLNVPYTPQSLTPTDTPSATSTPYNETGDAPTASFTVKTNANVNLRSGPSTDNAVLVVIPADTLLGVYEITGMGAWYKVDYNGVKGWVSAATVVWVSAP